MPPRGRPPKPAHLKLLEGNPGKRKLPDNEPKPEPRKRMPTPPRTLDKKGKKEWRRMAKVLMGLGLLTELDLTALHMYCDAYERWRKYSAELEKGFLIKTPSEFLRPSPYVAMARDALAQVKTMAEHFGMTPATRDRVHPLAPHLPDDVEERLFGPRN